MDVPVLGRILDTLVLPKGVSIKRHSRDQRIILNEVRRAYELTLVYRKEEVIVAFSENDTLSEIPLVPPILPLEVAPVELTQKEKTAEIAAKKLDEKEAKELQAAKDRIKDGEGTEKDRKLVAELEPPIVIPEPLIPLISADVYTVESFTAKIIKAAEELKARVDTDRENSNAA